MALSHMVSHPILVGNPRFPRGAYCTARYTPASDQPVVAGKTAQDCLSKYLKDKWSMNYVWKKLQQLPPALKNFCRLLTPSATPAIIL